ncbi:hypothetical protein ACLQ24_11575 [Micromonospora sp. DT4]|uniref:hypothetical protein n=1 Tax=Micromonospora sp. DT4 TaxID=3393438 RepID=UPI003CEAA543
MLTDPMPADAVQTALKRVSLAAEDLEEAHSLGLHALAAALRERGHGCLHLGPALPWPALTSAVRRARPYTVVLWSRTPVTGRAYRLVRFARDSPTCACTAPDRAGSNRSPRPRATWARCRPPSLPA